MQADETSLEIAPSGHLVPAIVVGVTYHETRKHEEEIHRHITMVNNLRPYLRNIGLEGISPKKYRKRQD